MGEDAANNSSQSASDNGEPDSKGKEEDIEEDIVIEKEDEQPKDTIKRLRDELKECVAKKREYLQGWQRAKADNVNARKEFDREKDKIKTRAIESVMSDILPVLDSFEMAFADEETWQSIDEQWRSGVEHIHSQLTDALANNGLKKIAPKPGDDFDPQLHTSIDTKKAETEDQIDTVADCEQTGYRLDDRIIRSANVVVYADESGKEERD